LNRLIDVGNPGGADACSGSSPAGITYGYDGASNLTSSCDALGTTNYYYDVGNRLTSEVEPGGTSGCAVSRGAVGERGHERSESHSDP